MRLEELRGRRVAVWGRGREGQAAQAGAEEAGAAEVETVDEENVRRVETLSAGDVLVLSPGVSRYRREVREAEERGVEVTSGTKLFLAEHGERTVAVTGSKGKSTTTTLLAHLGRALGEEVHVGGNLGVPLLTLRDTPGLVVAEVSSYQGALLTGEGAQVALLTALFPDHLPWHGSEEAYTRDKLKVLASATTKLVNTTDPGARGAFKRSELTGAKGYGGSGTYARSGSRVRTPGGELELVGTALAAPHNVAHTAGALAALEMLGHDVPGHLQTLQEAVRTYRPLAHRLETVRTRGNVRYVDDTLATTPQATLAALGAHRGERVAVILGGLDRGVAYTPLAEALQSSPEVVAAALVGEAGRRIQGELGGVCSTWHPSLQEATRAAARALGEEGGVVLLSPAAASEPPETYEDRSRTFQEVAEEETRQGQAW